MALSFKNISYAYGETKVLHDLCFEAKDGEITCLLGPSGGGKSTLLRLAAGIEHVQSGRVEIDGELIASESFFLPPEKRPVGLMFQEDALFPHMTIAENVGFGLIKLDKKQKALRVDELLTLVGLSNYGDRYPHSLSGGQQQRVALIRSLAPNPRVLLMDEPYASIDITLRRSLREAARHTLKLGEITSVMVTHDPPEAMEMADTIAVLDDGLIVQVGSPQTLYEQPANACVASLFGDAQQFSATFSNGHFKSAYGDITLTGSDNPEFSVRGGSGTSGKYSQASTFELVVRPDGLRMINDPASKLYVADLRFVGENWVAFLLSDEMPTSASALRVNVREGLSIGDRVSLATGDKGFYVF